MITRLKKEDLKEAMEGNHELYNELSLVADKLRTIYVALGWTHMTAEFSEADDTVEYLTKGVLESIYNGQERSSHATAGLCVEAYWEEGLDTLSLDYSFKLI